jgi:hypothetical protein
VFSPTVLSLPYVPTQIRATDEPLFPRNPKQCFNVALINRFVGRVELSIMTYWESFFLIRSGKLWLQ